jgi:hypothetical protein
MEYKQNMELIGYVDVPRYSRPDQHGVELDQDKRLSLAVHRAVEPAPACDGHTFLVLDELDGDYERVEYIQNPAFDAIWDPTGDAQ